MQYAHLAFPEPADVFQKQAETCVEKHIGKTDVMLIFIPISHTAN